MVQQSSTLRVGVDSTAMVTGARAGEQALDRLGRKARTTETQFQRLQRQMGGMRTLFAGLGIGIAVREFSRLLDVTTTIDNRLRLVTGTTEELNAVYGELLSISNTTRTSLQDNAALFNRMALATKQLNLSYREQLDLTKTLNQALVISGASAAEGGAGLIQLSQGLAAGALRGEELRSVLENLPKVADVIAEGMGVARGDLLELGKAGKISAQAVVDAFKEAADDLDAEFAKITPTIAGAFTVFNNQMIDFTRNLNHASGIGEMFARTILFLADNFNAVAGAAAGLAIIIGGVLTRSILVMTAALMTNPIGLLVVGIAAATAAIGAFGDTTVEVGGRVVTVWQVVKAAIMTVVDVLVVVRDTANAMFASMAEVGQEYFESFKTWLGDWVGNWGISLDDIGGMVKDAVNFWIGLHVGFVKAIGPTITQGIPALFALAMGIAKNIVLDGLQSMINSFAKGLGAIGGALDLIPGIEGVGAAIRENLTVDFSDLRTDTETLRTEVAAAGEAISGAFNSGQKDYVGAFGDAVRGVGADLKETFNANLDEVIENQEKSVDLNEILSRTLNGGVSPALDGAANSAKGAADAMKKLNAERQKFMDSIDDEYNAILAANGGAQDQVRAWYQEQLVQLQALGLAYTEYADKVEAIFNERLSEAYKTDLANATDWRSGVERALQNLGESVGSEADLAEAAITSVFNNAANAVANFAKTGKLDFKEFARSVAADILMLTTKMLLFKALKGILGGFGFSEGGEVPGFATGGYVRGPGHGTSDSIPAMLSNGEYVVNAQATDQFRPLLEAINAGNMDLIGLSAGGLANDSSALPAQPAAASQPVKENDGDNRKGGAGNITIIPSISGADIVDAFDSDDGVRVMLNMLERNKTTIRGVLS